MKQYIVVLFVTIFFVSTAFSQSDKRLAQNLTSIKAIPAFTLPQQDNQQLMDAELAARAPARAPKYAVNLPVEVSPDSHGTWETTSENIAVWRMKIKSPDAKAINLGFTKYLMPRGGKLFLYTSNYEEVFGPFTPADNEEHEQLWTPNLSGDEIVIEVQLPANEVPNLDLKLEYVNHAFQDFSSAAILSGSCNLDVICGAADGWGIVDPHRDIIQSVAVISTGGGTFCTGFLISNANQDCTPYFMTADHCGIGAGQAPSLVAYWNFFNSTCRQPNSAASGNAGNGTLSDFNTGSILRASNSASDFTLVEFDDPISATANAYFAGYDATGVGISSAIAVHHPSTDEKRISFENDPTSFTTYGSSTPVSNYTHVRVADWDVGTTEGGSSGSPLFDQNERVVGQLHGGGAACGNSLSDWYGSFAVSWNGGGTSSTRLRDWLDPNNTNTLINDGYYATGCDFSVVANPSSQDVCAGSSATYTLTVSAAFTGTVSLSATGLPAGMTANFSPSSASPGSNVTLTINNTGAFGGNSFAFNVTGNDGQNTSSNTLNINILPGAGTPPVNFLPANNSVGVSLSPTLSWNGVSGVDYVIQIATDASFSNIIDVQTIAGNMAMYSSPFTADASTTYYWRVQSISSCGNSQFNTPWSFTTANIQCETFSILGANQAIGPNAGTVTVVPLNVPLNVDILDVNIPNINLTHTWVSDLRIQLESPTNLSAILVEDICGDNNNLNLGFDDQSPNPYTSITCPPTNSQSYMPLNNLSVFDGTNAQGLWVLRITDFFNQDGGTLFDWSIQICYDQGNVAPVTATGTVIENNECFGDTDGIIEVTANGGTPPFSYSLNGGTPQNNGTFEDLPAGNYSVLVTDAANTSFTVSNLNISQPASLNASVNVNNNTATVNASGGTQAYSYSLDGTNFQSSNVFNNLSNGTYSVTVEDVNGCSTSENFTIALNTVTVSAQIIQTINCNNGNNGAITAFGGGGQPPYTYTINGGNAQSTGEFTGLNAGSYQITVTDSNGFSQTTAAIILQNPAIISLSTNVSTDNVTLTASGGSPAYQYSIDGQNYQSSNQFISLSNGNYTAYVQDANGCISTSNFSISVNNLAVTFDTDRITCHDMTNGSITVNATGGSTPYQYSLNNGNFQFGNTFSNLGGGNYNVTVIDADGFTVNTGTISLVAPDELSVASIVDDNQISAFGNGGTEPYQFSLNNGSYQLNNIFSNLANGTYILNILDANGCASSQSVEVAFNNLIVTLTETNITCNGDSNGTITANATGGNPPYSYSLNNENTQNNGSFTNLSGGTYQVTVYDNDGLSMQSASVMIEEPAAISVSASVDEDEITITASGGTGSLQYSIDGQNFHNGNIFSDLANGTYSIMCQDANGCLSSMISATVAVNSIVATATATSLICHDDNNGTITADATGDNPPFQYSLNGIDFQDEPLFEDLAAGTYQLTVLDSDGFTQLSNFVTITNPDAITASAAVNEYEVTVTAEGGTGNLQYSIDGVNYQASPVFADLTNGTYSVSIQDANGCTISIPAVVAVNTLVVTAAATGITCHDANDGIIIATVSGGNPPLQYSLNGGEYQASPQFTGLGEGIYQITVIDNDNFTQTSGQFNLFNPSEITLNASVNENEITVNAQGGTGDLQYSIDGQNYQTSNIFTDLNNGVYTLYVQDINGCTNTTSATIAVNSLLISATGSDISCHNENDGTITASVSGGMMPYTYSIDGENFQESNTFENLSAGQYTITVQDAEGFTQTTIQTISNPPVLILELSVLENNITAIAEGGTGEYSYSIDNQTYQQSGIFLDLPNGNYTVYVQDANACTQSQSIVIAINTLAVSAAVTQEIICFGEAMGMISVSITGGMMPYQYSIDGGESFQVSNQFTSLSAGAYTVLVQDSEGFSITTEELILDQPDLLTITTTTDESTIIATAAGGTEPYSYSLEGADFSSENEFPNLANGVYEIAVQDANGCISTGSQIVAIDAIIISATLTNSISCYNGNDATVSIEAAGGSAPYQYSIDGENYQESNIFGGLGAGEYTFSVLDNLGNPATSTLLNIENPEQINPETTVTENVVLVTATGGTGIYQYSLDGENYQDENEFADLLNGTYTAYVQDSNGCIESVAFTISVNTLFADASITQEILCAGESTGIIQVETSGGTEPYTYSIDNGENYQDSNIFEGLIAGDYEVTVQDADGFTFTTSLLTITEPDVLELDAQVISTSIIASGSGGTEPYQYSIGNGDFQDSGTFNDIVNGEYEVIIRDKNGCETSVLVVMDQVSVNDISNRIAFEIFPNPNAGVFKFELENELRGVLNIKIYNIIGQQLFEQEVNKGADYLQLDINVNYLPAGTYEVLISTGEFSGIKQLLVIP